jgi:hypothetical protein
MAENVEDLSVHYEEGGQVTTEELDKVVLTKGAWATIIYKFRDWDQKKEDYGPTKFTIRRYQKRNGAYRQQSKFNISSVKQATGIVEALKRWMDEEGA